MKEGNMMSYEMYEDFKETMVKTIKTELSAKHNQSTDTNLPQRIEQIVHTEQERHRAMIGMMSTIVLLCTMLYWAARPNYDRIDNDLKYRYIKMKGKATSDRIAELEELFEQNRDNAKIREMKRDVEEYERTVKRKVQLEEQARLKEREAERLNENASRLKNK